MVHDTSDSAATAQLLQRVAAGNGGALAELFARHRPALERYGVARAAVFGSVARGQARRDSDVDIFVEFDRERSPDLFRYMQMQEELGALVAKATGRRVDVIDIDSMRETTRERALQDAVYAY